MPTNLPDHFTKTARGLSLEPIMPHKFSVHHAGVILFALGAAGMVTSPAPHPLPYSHPSAIRMLTKREEDESPSCLPY